MEARVVTGRQALLFLVLGSFFLVLPGCEQTNLPLAVEAGMDVVQTLSLTDAQVYGISVAAAGEADGKNRVAPAGNAYGQRLERLVSNHLAEEGMRFNYKIYLDPTVNAFAMADGSIRIYSGLMDMMDDDELRFVIGHEMGHVLKKHIRKKLILAYAGRAVRKGVASQENLAGDIARSALGDVAEQLLNAQFSQGEEREADDHGLVFLRKNGYRPEAAVSALDKLVTLGDDHSFLASHPAPGMRAERLRNQLRNPDGGKGPSLWDSLAGWLTRLPARIVALITALLQGIAGWHAFFAGQTRLMPQGS